MPQDKPSSHIGGLVLAGGRSVRFGSEKAVAVLRGRPLLDWALNHLSLVAGRTAVSAPMGSQARRLAVIEQRTVLADAPGDAAGPLSGIRAGLDWAQGQGARILAVEACDTPLLPADLHSRLLEALGDAPAAYAQTDNGPQPLCSVWRIEALPTVAAALADGEHPPIWRLLQDLQAVAVPFEDGGRFANTNHLEDLQAAAQRLS